MFPFLFLASIAFFHPPEGWQMADPKQLSPHVEVLFLGSPEKNFAPTINLATEKTDSTPKEYFKDVKELHKSTPGETWRDLGKFQFACGEGRLTEITVSSPAGEIKMLQALFVQDKTAYVLTGAVLKEFFTKHQSELVQAIRSLKIVPNLLDTVPSEERTTLQGILEAPTSKEEKWEAWQKALSSVFKDQGEHWHFLALREGWSKIQEGR
jgi:hypothetical protein